MAKKNGLLDFMAIRRDTSFETVLTHYNLAGKGTGAQLKLNCPFHDDSTPSLAVNLEKGIFNCFGCSAKGNVFDFIALMEEYDDNATFKSAKKALAIIGRDPSDYRRNNESSETRQEPLGEAKTSNTAQTTGEAPKAPQKAVLGSRSETNKPVENPVLTISLKLDYEHEFLTARGVTPEQAEAFGLGYCKTGIMKNRIAIPIHNRKGELVAFTGRFVGNDEDIPENEGKYKLPKGFEKSLEVFNLNRAEALGKRFVVIVEGIWSTLRLHHAGIPTVALLGTSISDQQAEQIASAGFNHAVLILDGDEAGRTATPAVLYVLAKHLYVKTINLEEGVKPDTMDDEVVNRLRR